MPFDPVIGLPTAMALRLGPVALTVALARRPRAARHLAFIGSALASIITGLAAGAVLSGDSPAHGTLFVHRASGFAPSYTLDALSAWFLVVLSLLAVPIAIFSIGYGGHGLLARRSAFLGAAFNVLLGAVEVVFVADNVIGFLFAWELMTLATAALVTGPVTRNMEIALRKTFEATPEPRIVVAVGACGCSGGILGEGTYAAMGGVDRIVPVDVYIPGCPPRPQAILSGLLVAMGVREARLEPEQRP